VDYSDIQLSDIDADIRRFKPSQDSLSFFIRSLHFAEKSGFILQKFTGEFSESKTFLSFRDLNLRTSDSDIKGREISLRFNSWGQFKADSFARHVRLNIDLFSSLVNLRNIGYFAPVFRYSGQLISFTGKVAGPLQSEVQEA
jgi:hypothetical protein